MKHLFTLVTLCILITTSYSQSNNVGIGTTTPDASAALDITASDKGILIPRLSTTQRENITSPAEGLMVYDSTTQTFWYYIDEWKEISPYGVFKDNGIAVSHTGVDTSDFIFGEGALPVSGQVNSGEMFFFDKSKAAFRAGKIENTKSWNPDSIGVSSVAMGDRAKASGEISISLGNGSKATAKNSIALGKLAEANGFSSFAAGEFAEASAAYSTAIGFRSESIGGYSSSIGYYTKAGAYRSTALGAFNVGSGDPSSWVDTDPILEVGIGTSPGNRENAMKILKDGTISFKEYTFPNEDGTLEQVMSTDGTGNLSWSSVPSDNANDIFTNTQNINTNAANIFNNTIAIDAHVADDTDLSPTNELQTLSISGQDLTLSSGNTITLPDDTGIFETNANVIQYTGPNEDDFTLGLDSFPINGESYSEDGLYYDGGKSAFRIGSAYQTESWNPTNLGLHSVGIGLNNQASGYTSVAMGGYNLASGYASAAFNYLNAATGFATTAFGEQSQAKGDFSFAAGKGTTTDAYSSAAFGRYNLGTGNEATWIETDPLFEIGNGTDHSNRANALTILKNGTVSFENYTFPDADGTANQMLKTDGAGNLDWISIPDDADSNPTNELLVGFNFSGNTLNITDAGGTLNTDISSVKPHTIEDNEGDSKIEFNSVDNKILFTTNGNVTAKIEPDSMYIDGNLKVGAGAGAKLYIGNAFLQSSNASIIKSDADFRPEVDDTYDLGSSGKRWQDVWATNGVIQTSDRRLKKNITSLNYGLEEVLKLQPVQYNWKKEREDEKLHVGLIAQELLQIIPEVVNEEGEYLGVKYAELVPVLIQAIKDQQDVIKTQNGKIEELQHQNDSSATLMQDILDRIYSLEKSSAKFSINE